MAEGRRVVRSEFGNQKPESVLDIFCAATSKSRISRAEIAKMTGLSVVTVGKVVDALLSLKILRQTTSLDPAPGRKSRVLSAAGGLNIVVFNLATPSYTVHICDLMQHTVDTYTYHYNADYFPDENLHFFFEQGAKYASEKIQIQKCCGCAILTPGDYDDYTDRILFSRNPRLSGLAISSIFEKYSFGTMPPLIRDIRRFTLDAALTTLHKGGSALCVFLEQPQITSCYLRRGDSTQDARFCHFGNLNVGNGRTVEDFVCRSKNVDAALDALTRTLYWIFSAVHVDKIVLTGSLYTDAGALALLIGERLTELPQEENARLPEVLGMKYISAGVNSAAVAVKKNWFLTNVLQE